MAQQFCRPRRTRLPGDVAASRAGQSLVEFSLVLPLFMLLMIAVFEFGFVFNAILSVSFASRDAALIAAEAGNAYGADCVTLNTIEKDITAPAQRTEISTVEIYWSDPNGSRIPGAVNVYTRNGAASPLTCTYPDGTKLSVPYVAQGIGYAETSRCNTLAGCGGAHAAGVDTIGVDIHYTYRWKTPFAGLIGNFSGSFEIEKAAAMRMEPNL